jgi:hypothetical protein
MASTSLARTISSGSDINKFTYSFWVKRSGNMSSYQRIISNSVTSSKFLYIRFVDNDTFQAFHTAGGSTLFNLITTQVFRDPSAWYHIVIKFDSTQSTQADRTILYVNGSQVTSLSTSTYPSQNAVAQFINTNERQDIGYYASTSSEYFDGYMTHLHFTEGYTYAASTFGSTATNGQWVPNLNPSVTYGTNGYFLKFTNASDLGEDFSGNNNDFTKTGSGDKTNDNPQNVFASLNPLYKQGSPTFSEGNTKVVLPAGDGTQGAAANLAPPAGKWYWEIKQGSSTNSSIMVREASDKEDDISYYQGSYAGYELNDGNQNVTGNTTSVYGAAYADGDIIMVALDMDNNRVYFGKNGLWADGAGNSNQSSLDDYVPLNGVTNGVPAVTNANGSASATFQFNFGNPAFTISSGNADGNGKGTFEYAPPTNYLALCTDNLSSALTQPIGKGGSYMNTVLYTGNGANGHAITGVGFQPDLVWLKSRSNGEGHWWGDSNRGVNLRLQSNTDSAEYDTGPGGNNYPGVSAFDSDGFTVGRSDAANGSGNSMVAWNWRASGSTTSNTDGDITTTVTANTTSGFSILKWTGNGSASQTLGHGLGVTPKFVINKNRSQTAAWQLFGSTIFDRMQFNTQTEDQNLPCGYSSSLITLPAIASNTEFNSSGDNFITYVFAEKEGYCKINSYTGNGSSDGAFVYTGFRPALILMKSLTGTENWLIYDDVRDPFNVTDEALLPNTGDQSGGSSNAMDLLSNGFKFRSSAGSLNGSSQTYFYMAIAKNPFVDSSGVPANAR